MWSKHGTRSGIAQGPRGLLVLAILTGALIVPGRVCQASSASAVAARSDDPRLDRARTLFEKAAFDSSLAVLEALTSDASLSGSARQDVYRLMGLIHTLKGNQLAARAAIRRWIEIDPDAARPDPDRDLLEFVHLFFEVRKEYNEQAYCAPGFRPPHPCQFILDRPDPGIRTIAVVDFDNNAIDQRARLDPLRGGLADLVIRQLSGTIGLKIVEREWLGWLLEEIELNRTGGMDPQTAVRVGRLIGAHTVLLGDFMYLNETLTLGARVVKVESGELLLVAEEEGRLEAVSRIAGTLSREIARASNRRLRSGEVEERTPTNDLGALLSYAEGLAFYDEGKYEAAAAKFADALEKDPDHVPAREKYASLQPVLAVSGEIR